MTEPTCPFCGNPGTGKKYDEEGVAIGWCGHSFHKGQRPRKGRKVGWRTLDDARNTTRGNPDLEDQDPEDRRFGGPGTVIVTVDSISGGDYAENHACDDPECLVCYRPKRKPKRKRAK